MKHLASSLFCSLCLWIGSAPARADVPALSIGGGEFTVGHSNNSATTLGWALDVTSDKTVTALGYYDQGSDGLLESHELGIFDASGVLLVSATLSAGTAGTLIDGFRYVAISAFVLAPGAYTAAGTIGADASDPVIYFASDPVPAAGIAISAQSSRYTEAGAYTSLTFPNLNWPPANLYLGPNLIVQVPEPGSGAMLLLGASMVCAWARRRRARGVLG